MKRIWPILPMGICLLCWTALSCANHGRILPSPWATACALGALLTSAGTWHTLFLTLARGAGGLLLGSMTAIVSGIFCGRHPLLHDAVAPLITLGQSCPPIVWISLLLVWLSSGAAVPLAVALLSVFPILFINTANATRALDRKWFELAKVYRLPPRKRLTGIILPGIAPSLFAGFSYALGITWKVTATAEFFGAQDGIGAQIYLCYRNLELPDLFAWTILIACLGVAIDTFLVRRLRTWH
ncbi:MAG: ABC transporter permease subunit [Lentisphaeria bacterium]|nr:ABC transporter permease subunit [Lentisphaeria bacterium]